MARLFALDDQRQAELDELRALFLRRVLLGIPIVTASLGFAYAFAYERMPFGLGFILPAALAVWLVGLRLSTVSHVWAARVCVTSFFILVFFATWVWPEYSPGVLFTLVVTVAAWTLGIGETLVVVVAATVCLAVGAPDVAATGGAWSVVPVVLTWSSLGLAWLALEPLQTALGWYAASYSQELVQIEELRRHRGELGRTVKSLHESYDRLHVLNRELSLAREEADRARRLKGEFATNLAHELGTPVNLIVGFTELLLDAARINGEALPTGWRRDVDAVHRNAQHLAGLIDDVLDLGQLDAGRLGLYREVFAPGEVAQEAVSVVQRLFEAKGLSLELDVAEAIPAVNADRTRIRQILVNLLNNAARYTETGGACVAVRATEREVVFDVADTGPGIPSDELRVVFNEFQRLGQGKRSTQSGHGLGLSICRRFVEMHRGSIWVESTPGTGTTFSFSLPFAHALVPVEDRVPRAPEPGRTPDLEERIHTVVAVAEDPALRRLFARHLAGYHVRGAATWTEALALSQEEAVHAFLVVRSSAADCVAALQETIGAPNHAATIICAVRGRGDVVRALGATSFLAKPVSRDQVEEVLGRLGARKRRMLVVDDDPDMVRLLAGIVRAQGRGHSVSMASSGAEALALLRERRHDLVFLDLLMPDLDGREVIRQIRADPALQALPIVVISSAINGNAVIQGDLVVIRGDEPLTGDGLMRCLQAALGSVVQAAPGSDVLPSGGRTG